MQDFVVTLSPVAATDARTKTPYVEFAARLRGAMSNAGVRPIDVSRELKVDPETVRLWLKGERMPGDARLKRLAKMVGLDPADLRYGPDKNVTLSHMQGELVTDEDELALLRAYRGLQHCQKQGRPCSR